MKVAAIVTIAISGMALAAPSTPRDAAKVEKDLSQLRYGNSVPIPKVSAEKRDVAKIAKIAALKYGNSRPLHVEKREVEAEDISHLRYGNAAPVSDDAVEKRDAKVPVKDNRSLKYYANDIPATKAEA